MATKTAKKTVVVVELTCPHCGEVLPHPHTGSHNWDVNEVRTGETAVCPNCSKAVKLPKV